MNKYEELLEDVQTPCFSSMYSSDTNSNCLELENFCINCKTSEAKEANEYNCFSSINSRREVNLMCRYNCGLGYHSTKFNNINAKLWKGKSSEYIDLYPSLYGNILNTSVCICKCHTGDKLSVSLPDLRAFNMEFPSCEFCATPFRYKRLAKSIVLIQSKMFRSMPNINFINDYVIPLHNRRNIFHRIRMGACFLSNTLGQDWILVPMNCHYFEDALFKMLIKRLHSEHESVMEKDVILFELQQIYDKLLLKHAEAENIIDRMRFGELISPITETTTVNNKVVDLVRNMPTMKHDETNKRNECWNSYLEYQQDEIEDTNSSPQEIDLENPSLDNIYNERAFRHLISVSRNKKDIQFNVEINENCDSFIRQKEINNYEKDLNGTFSVTQKILKEQPEKDIGVLSQYDIAVHCSREANKMKLEKCNTQSPEMNVYSTKDMLSDCKISLSSEDDFSVVGIKNSESMDSMGFPSIQSRISNNWQHYFNNKRCANAKQKRDLIAHPKVYKYCSLLEQQNKHDFFHSLPAFGIDHYDNSTQKYLLDQRSCKTSVNLSCENHNSKKETILIKPPHNIIDNTHRQFEGRFLMDEVAIKSNLNPKNDLKTLIIEEQDFQRCFYNDKTGSSLKMFDSDLEELRKCSLNELNLEIRSNFGGIHSKNYTCDGHLDKTKVMEEFYFDKSDSDISCGLPSVELEACDCWHESSCFPKDFPQHVTQTNCNREALPSHRYPQLSPLCLEISSSSSVDFSLPTISPVLMESSRNYATVSSNEDLVEPDGRMEENSFHQIPANHSYINRNTSSCVLSNSSRIMKFQQNENSKQMNKKNVSHLLNSLNKADCLALKLKDRSERLKIYLAQQLDNVS